MTKGERRRARKKAQKEGRPLTGELAIRSHRECQTDGPAVEFTESAAGRWGLDRWARWYDEMNGAPEGDWDR